MNIEIRNIDGIALAKYNPRKMSKDAHASLVASIKRFGFVDPVIVNNRTGVLVGGHQRINAAKELGLVKIPVVSVDLDEVDEKALNVALNKISGEWDMDALRQVIDDVLKNGISATEIGFSDAEISKIIKADIGEIKEVFFDEEKHEMYVNFPNEQLLRQYFQTFQELGYEVKLA